jgi:hypothetical protein
MSQLGGHIGDLLRYLQQRNERANEDLALRYFRHVFGDEFRRQSEAGGSDGYLPGRFVLELKGQASDWLAGLLQALLYEREGLTFRQVVVGAKEFLAVWQTDAIPSDIKSALADSNGPPNKVGRDLAALYRGRRRELLSLASWTGTQLFTPLFGQDERLVVEKLRSLEDLLKSGAPARIRVTTRNFTSTLKEMVPYFDTAQPLKAVRAFFSMLYGWDADSVLALSQRNGSQATLSGEVISHLQPSLREAFKEFVERRFIYLGANENHDDFFAKYDEALDAVDANFRKRHGIYFTDLYLSKFVMAVAKRYVPALGRDYLVLDPACGSGNLVTNWRSPLDLRHKVVSEIEPELLFAVEQRMKGDAWHRAKYTVVPKVQESRGLNFLDRSAEDYLSELRTALHEKGQAPDKPLAILCNPPYRSDDDQTTSGAGYDIHSSILAVTGADASQERYCCFLAQMKLICDSAACSGLPGQSLLLLFTKSAWLTDRAIFKQIRAAMAGSFADVAGVLVDGSEFFDIAGKWPVAFTIWQYRGSAAQLDSQRTIPLQDLTWVRRRDLLKVDWSDATACDAECERLINDPRSSCVAFGVSRRSMRHWTERQMIDFKRDRRRAEVDAATVGGLPLGDRRRSGKKTYGESEASFIGFMDDLTPCRVKRGGSSGPWFRLNPQFMDARKNRCLSGPPTHFGYAATDRDSAQKLFTWYAIARVFAEFGYPMWADAEDLWQPNASTQDLQELFGRALAIGYADNECVETYFPANNPVGGAPELYLASPLTPLIETSFCRRVLRPAIIDSGSVAARALVNAVEAVYAEWLAVLGGRPEVPFPPGQPYFLDERPVTRGAGLPQLKSYATYYQHKPLLAVIGRLQEALREAKEEFYHLLTDENSINYFSRVQQEDSVALPEDTAFQRALARRLAVAGVLVEELGATPSFGRTKLAKLFYLADARTKLQLKTQYLREAAGPLDPRALYHKDIGIEALAEKHGLFRALSHGRMIRYESLPSLQGFRKMAQRLLGEDEVEVRRIASLFRDLDTDQAEIAATLFACWNDLLLQGARADEEAIIREFGERWNPSKTRFPRSRLVRALQWMVANSLIPNGNRKAKTAPRQLVQ